MLKNKKALILVDGFFLRTERGVGLHIRNLLETIKTSKKFEFVLLVPQRPIDKLILENEAITIKRIKFSRNIFFWYNIVFPCYSFLLKSRACLFPANICPVVPTHGKLFLTLHDVMFITESGFDSGKRTKFQSLGRIYLRLNLWLANKRINRVITISHYSKKKITEFYPKLNVQVVYQGPGQEFKKRLKFNLVSPEKKYILRLLF